MSAVTWVTLALVWVGLEVWIWRAGGTLYNSWGLVWLVPALVAAVSAAVSRRRIRRASAHLDAGGLTRPMRLQQWWAPDPEGGVAAWVSLSELGVAPGDRPVVGQPIVGLPDGFRAPEGAVADVVGDPRPGRVVHVRVGTTVLKPAGQCRQGVGPSWPTG